MNDSASPLALHAMPMEVRNCQHSILGSLQSQSVLTRKHQMNLAFIIGTIRKLG